ncbi:hypothetical protein [Paucibacter sp. B51]|uniref:hypothetical protein n=1 Tax=Paucibacter sp. B51 TaxID=2993315 RepID=UPI0022EBD037|nr:hypothetical protein [Paucibacter sp. B51]
MNTSEPTWTQILQRSVHWWVIGGALCLIGMAGASRLLELAAGDDPESWVNLPAAVLHYSLFPTILVVAHLFFVISILGLAVLPRKTISNKTRTLGLCFFGLVASLVVLVPLYFGLGVK